MNKSNQRGKFSIERTLKLVQEGTKTEEDANDYINCIKSMNDHKKDLEMDPEWQKNNLEYDLRSTKWICDKVKSSESYAQNLYAALCNNDFTKNQVWPVLQGQKYSCSWRYAGGIIADMQEKGDYIDWYCSGIKHEYDQKTLDSLTDEQKEYVNTVQKFFVGEGYVTDEIKEDLLKLGWLVTTDDSDIL